MMFLHALKKRNPQLIDKAVQLFRSGHIQPDSYVIDVDAVLNNAQRLKRTADQYGIQLYAMTKQIGRNPYLAKRLVDEVGFSGIVCVDYREALLFQQLDIKVSHIGHLVQPPKHLLHKIMQASRPEIITVTSIEKAKQISNIAVELGIKQSIMLKFISPNDLFYPNQESGFPLEEIAQVYDQVAGLPNIEVSGLTHFPCFLANKNGSVSATENLETLKLAHQKWQKLGGQISHLNLPSLNCCATLPMLAQFGATHAEPGHALTGTTPINRDGEQEETIAMLYLSEISHHYLHDSYCFGGGYYRRGQLSSVLVFPNETNQSCQEVSVFNDDDTSIDYHLRLKNRWPIGSAVVAAFRSQIFVTRSEVVLIEGLQTGNPKIIGTWDAQGRLVRNAT
ncbi:alanine racemase [Vibrio sp. DNB22_10_4]|jgi:predicted amino acid racemase